MLLFPLWHFPCWFVRKIGISKSFLGNSCDWTPSMSMLGGKIHFIVWSFLLVQQHISHEFKSNFSFINKARLSLNRWLLVFISPSSWLGDSNYGSSPPCSRKWWKTSNIAHQSLWLSFFSSLWGMHYHWLQASRTRESGEEMKFIYTSLVGKMFPDLNFLLLQVLATRDL